MGMMGVPKRWEKVIDPNNKYGGAFILGDRNVEVPPTAVVSVTRGEQFNIPRLMINGFLNQMIMKAMSKNENLLYAELKGQLDGGIGQTMTVWKEGKQMNSFERVACITLHGNFSAGYFIAVKFNPIS